MATTDSELAEEVRQFTGYTDTSTISDSDLESIIQIGKQEFRARFGQPNFTFYRQNPSTNAADRALFWWTCIGVKVRLGELGNIGLSVEGLESTSPNEHTYEFWHSRFLTMFSRAETQFAEESGAASRSIERDERNYDFDLPDL